MQIFRVYSHEICQIVIAEAIKQVNSPSLAAAFPAEGPSGNVIRFVKNEGIHDQYVACRIESSQHGLYESNGEIHFDGWLIGIVSVSFKSLTSVFPVSSAEDVATAPSPLECRHRFW